MQEVSELSDMAKLEPGPGHARPASLAIVLLRIIGPLFTFACLVSVFVICTLQRNWLGVVLSVVLAVAYGVRIAVRLHRTGR